MDIKQGSVFAYRIWYFGLSSKTQLPALMSVTRARVWPYRTDEAVCIKGFNTKPHRVPYRYCTCGFYGYKDLSMASSEILTAPYILACGEVEMFGRVWYHSMGYRSQFARVHSISPESIECIGCGISINIDNEPVFAHRINKGGLFPLIFLGLPLCDECYIRIRHRDPKLISWLIEFKTSGQPDKQVEQYIMDTVERCEWFDLRSAFRTLCELYCDGRRFCEKGGQHANI